LDLQLPVRLVPITITIVSLNPANGEGKSTFMRVLAGEIEADEGKLKIKNGIKIS
jgi:ATP-binding cassette subfamily F protein uup